MTEKTYEIEIDQYEALFLSDQLSMFTEGPPGAMDGQGKVYPELLLKVGSAMLESGTGKPVNVAFTVPELWMIREVAKSTVMVASVRVGLNLIMKVFKELVAHYRAEEAGIDVDLMRDISDAMERGGEDEQQRDTDGQSGQPDEGGANDSASDSSGAGAAV